MGKTSFNEIYSFFILSYFMRICQEKLEHFLYDYKKNAVYLK